jgi:hypothetical protein
MASLLLGAGALLSDKIRKERKIISEHKAEYRFEEMQKENARLHHERQTLQQLPSKNNTSESNEQNVQPPDYDCVMGRGNT